jgi:hypothetical protein
MFVYRSSRSEVSALAHRAVPTMIECHVTLATCLHTVLGIVIKMIGTMKKAAQPIAIVRLVINRCQPGTSWFTRYIDDPCYRPDT